MQEDEYMANSFKEELREIERLIREFGASYIILTLLKGPGCDAGDFSE